MKNEETIEQKLEDMRIELKRKWYMNTADMDRTNGYVHALDWSKLKSESEIKQKIRELEFYNMRGHRHVDEADFDSGYVEALNWVVE